MLLFLSMTLLIYSEFKKFTHPLVALAQCRACVMLYLLDTHAMLADVINHRPALAFATVNVKVWAIWCHSYTPSSLQTAHAIRAQIM